MIPGLRTSFMQRCRWCQQEPEFASGEAELAKFCGKCDAVQDPVLNLRNPKTGINIAFFINPDDSLFIEFGKITGETTRYTMPAEVLRKAGMLQKFNQNPQGKK